LVSRKCGVVASNPLHADPSPGHYFDSFDATAVRPSRRAVVRGHAQENLRHADADPKAAKEKDGDRDKTEIADTYTDAVEEKFGRTRERSTDANSVTESEEEKDYAHTFADRVTPPKEENFAIAGTIRNADARAHRNSNANGDPERNAISDFAKKTWRSERQFVARSNQGL
jgi:hypothetical protein